MLYEHKIEIKIMFKVYFMHIYTILMSKQSVH